MNVPVLPWHLGPLHPVEQAATVALAFGPFLLLAVVITLRRRREDAEREAAEREAAEQGAAEEAGEPGEHQPRPGPDRRPGEEPEGPQRER